MVKMMIETDRKFCRVDDLSLDDVTDIIIDKREKTEGKSTEWTFKLLTADPNVFAEGQASFEGFISYLAFYDFNKESRRELNFGIYHLSHDIYQTMPHGMEGEAIFYDTFDDKYRQKNSKNKFIKKCFKKRIGIHGMSSPIGIKKQKMIRDSQEGFIGLNRIIDDLFDENIIDEEEF